MGSADSTISTMELIIILIIFIIAISVAIYSHIKVNKKSNITIQNKIDKPEEKIINTPEINLSTQVENTINTDSNIKFCPNCGKKTNRK